MSALFKDVYSPEFYNKLAEVLTETLPKFNTKKFIKLIFSDEFEAYELKERMMHTIKVLHQFMDKDFDKAALQLEQIINTIRAKDFKPKSVEFMFFPEYIPLYGLDHYDTAVKALEFVTQFVTCEFGVRPFILQYPKKMMIQMHTWSKHESRHVRRLASEGARPRLPWGMGIPALKKDPSPLLPILENLKLDTCEIVRRSVANNLNDIAKDNPKIVIDIAKKWKGKNKETNALVKHACRTLLKQANPEVLVLFGYDSKHFKLSNFKINTPKVTIGDAVEFSFSIKNTDKKGQLARLEYGLYYMKKSGKLAKKVFKISERILDGNTTYDIVRKQSFRIITTRVFHKGKHQVSIIINGKEHELKDFELV